MTTTTMPAPVVLLVGKNLKLRYVLVQFGVALGDRKMAAHFLCFKNPSGEFRTTALAP